jgi:hypothetical protein
LYVRDLFARLRVGGAEMQREVSAALDEVLRDDEKCVHVVASDVPTASVSSSRCSSAPTLASRRRPWRRSR